jgi:hypothetical protein
VMGLDSRQAAEAWIVDHKARVIAYASSPRRRRAFRKANTP